MGKQSTFGKVVYAYARFSTKKQSLGDSERRQQENAQRWADEHGCDVKYIIDPGISARHGRNRTIGQFGAFVARLRLGELGGSPTLLIENFDRISREDITDALPQFLELIKLGATIVTLHNRMVYKHPIDLTEAMLALVEMKAASAYSANLAKRVSASWDRARRAASKGMCVHRQIVPGWLRQEGDTFVPIPERVELVKQLFNKALQGAGTQTMAAWLNRNGIKPWTHKGQSSAGWHATGVKLLLRNRSLVGEFQPHRDDPSGKRIPVGPPIRGYFPVVIEPALFNAVQGLLKTIVPRGQPSRDHWNLVAGLAWSGVDGSPMWGQKHSPLRQREVRHYLKSRGSILGLTVPSHYLDYGSFEERLFALLRHLDGGALVSAKLTDEIAAAKAKVAAVAQQIEKYRRLVRDEADPSPTLVRDLRALEKELTAAHAAEARAVARCERALDRPGPDTVDLSDPESRAALRVRIAQDFEKFVFDRDVVHCWFHEGSGHGFDLALSGPIELRQVSVPPRARSA